jgi:hypothetical protein
MIFVCCCVCLRCFYEFIAIYELKIGRLNFVPIYTLKKPRVQCFGINPFSTFGISHFQCFRKC